MEFILALQFLTAIPVSIRGRVEDRNLARSMAYYPLVGLILGIIAALMYALISLKLPGPVSNLAVIVLMVMITGNLHLDGLMDTVDGIYSGRPRERILEIMKDSRVGSHGVVAGVLTLLAKYTLLWQIPHQTMLFTLVIVPALGRWSQVYGSAMFSYARAEGGTGTFTDMVGKRELFWSSVTVLAAIVIGFLLQSGFLTVAVLNKEVVVTALVRSGALAGTVFVCTAGLGRYISGKLGGLTGDTYGAINECVEVVSLLALLIIFTPGSF